MITTKEVSELVKRLRDYDNCHDGDVDQAADVLEQLLERVIELGTDCHYLEQDAQAYFDACSTLAEMLKLDGSWQLVDIVERVHHLLVERIKIGNREL